MNGPESLVVIAGSRVFKPVHVLVGEPAGEDVEIPVTVHVVKVLGAVLHVVVSEGRYLAERTLLEVGGLIPELARGDVQLAIAVDVAHGNAFVVVPEELLHAPLELRFALWLGGSAEGEGENEQDEICKFHVRNIEG